MCLCMCLCLYALVLVCLCLCLCVCACVRVCVRVRGSFLFFSALFFSSAVLILTLTLDLLPLDSFVRGCLQLHSFLLAFLRDHMIFWSAQSIAPYSPDVLLNGELLKRVNTNEKKIVDTMKQMVHFKLFEVVREWLQTANRYHANGTLSAADTPWL